MSEAAGVCCTWTGSTAGSAAGSVAGFAAVAAVVVAVVAAAVGVGVGVGPVARTARKNRGGKILTDFIPKIACSPYVYVS